jgi:methionyl-tRNA formyltransferase
MKPSILFIGKKGDPHCGRAIEFVQNSQVDCQIIVGKRGEPFLEDLGWWKGDYIISYLSPWIIPEYLLNRAKKSSINFHPGPPEYPGIGCTNFAVYEKSDTFGVTCHHMNPKVDTGNIIAVQRFHLYEVDTVYSLTQRCYDYILTLYYDIMSLIILGKELPLTNENWKRKPYTRQELNDLCIITPEMTEDETKRRVKSVTFPNAPGAYIKIKGETFLHENILTTKPTPKP